MLATVLWSLFALLFYAVVFFVIVMESQLDEEISHVALPLAVFGVGLLLPYHPLPLQISSWVACACLLKIGVSAFEDDRAQGVSILLLAGLLAAVRLAAPGHSVYGLVGDGGARLWARSPALALLAGAGLLLLVSYPAWGGAVRLAVERRREERWERAREARRDRLTAQAATLPPAQPHDLHDLWRRSFVRVEAQGRGIEAIDLRVFSEVRRDLQVRIPPGTCFVAAGAHQNMAARAEVRFPLRALSGENVGVEATCINAARPVPESRDGFSRVEMVTGDLARFLAAAAGRDPMTVQAGAWAISDGYTAAQAQARLQRVGPDGRREAAITDAHVAEARAILEEIGVATPL